MKKDIRGAEHRCMGGSMGSEDLLRGVTLATVTPFRSDFALDEEGLRNYVRHLVSIDGVRGILCCGYTGEISSLSRGEQLRIVEICAEETGSDIGVLCGLQPTWTRDTIEFGRALRSAGADALQINSPYYNILRRGHLANGDSVVEFFQAVSDGVGLPLSIFQYPESTGLAYSPELLTRLASVENVIGVKEAVSMEKYAKDASALDGAIALYADNNTYTLLGMLLYGADGTMVGIANVGTELWVRLYDLASDGDVAEAVELTNARLVPLMDAFARDLGNTRWSFVGRVKHALWTMGLIEHAGVRPPEPALTERDAREVERALEVSGLVTAGSARRSTEPLTVGGSR
jgi:4-hydroxy-tetrahydrodipicolinate synthase